MTPNSSQLLSPAQVADCVCLMALNKPQAVPIDTHMLQVAVKHYGVKLHGKSLTQKVYTQIGTLIIVILMLGVISMALWLQHTCSAHVQPQLPLNTFKPF